MKEDTKERGLPVILARPQAKHSNRTRKVADKIESSKQRFASDRDKIEQQRRSERNVLVRGMSDLVKVIDNARKAAHGEALRVYEEAEKEAHKKYLAEKDALNEARKARADTANRAAREKQGVVEVDLKVKEDAIKAKYDGAMTTLSSEESSVLASLARELKEAEEHDAEDSRIAAKAVATSAAGIVPETAPKTPEVSQTP